VPWDRRHLLSPKTAVRATPIAFRGSLAYHDRRAARLTLVGLICLGIAVIRARVFPRWIGALFIVSPFVSVLGLPEPFAELSDYLAFIALITIGVQVVRTQKPRLAPAPSLVEGVPTAPLHRSDPLGHAAAAAVMPRQPRLWREDRCWLRSAEVGKSSLEIVAVQHRHQLDVGVQFHEERLREWRYAGRIG
jgi:hypothetical protein